MKIVQINIKNFRGIKEGEILLPDHGVLVGDNNVGKSTVLEAIDLVLSPDRLRRRPVVDEHDFFAGDYLDKDGEPVKIKVDVIVADLNSEQKRHFQEQLKFWDSTNRRLLNAPPPESTDNDGTLPAIHVVFEGEYDNEEDDFIGETYFQPLQEEDDEDKKKFKTVDKRKCGFLLLRTIRTGSRALSLERGSLLDIILNLEDTKVDMWERILAKLRKIRIDDYNNEDSGNENNSSNKNNSSDKILASIYEKLGSLVPSHWGGQPEMKVSDLTRESLRRTLNVFMESGVKNMNDDKHIAPFKKQGAGTVNMLLISMLSMIAERKQNVIFAMEEPEIAIPPYTQKSIINGIKNSSNQTLVTSHSPFVIEEYSGSEIVALLNENGKMSSHKCQFPARKNTYRKEIRQKYCEALLAKRVLIVEGKTEYDAIPVAAHRLQELDPNNFSNLEALGVAIICAEGDRSIPGIALSFKRLGKLVFAIYDKQKDPSDEKNIKEAVHYIFTSPEEGFEKLIINNVCDARLKEFFSDKVANDNRLEFKEKVFKFLKNSKGFGYAADLLATCKEDEIPEFIRKSLIKIKTIVEQKDIALSASESISLENSSNDQNL